MRTTRPSWSNGSRGVSKPWPRGTCPNARASGPRSWPATPTFDANGNLTRDETGRQFVYDAWNRLVAVKDAAGSTLKTYTYDGQHRRVRKTAGGTVTDLYYSSAWQVLEERVGGQVKAQYVWSPVYVDALVLRDRDTNGDCTLDERFYVAQDANYNVTALFDNAGNVIERYVYDPFGQVTVLDAGWNVLAGSAFGWLHLHQGGRFDATSGLYHFRHRDYSPTLGRWTSLDPIRYAAGDVNLYRYVGNSPMNATDPSGLQIRDPDSREAYRKWREEEARRRREKAIKDTDNAVTNMIEAMKNLTPQEKEKVKKEIQLLLDASRFDWPHPTGFFGKCYMWADEYDKRTRELQARLEKEMGTYFKVRRMFWDVGAPTWFIVLCAAGGGHPVEAWAELDPGHAAIQITFSDGTIIYLDDGNLGGIDHVFVPSEVPSRYRPTKGYPLPIKFPSK